MAAAAAAAAGGVSARPPPRAAPLQPPPPSRPPRSAATNMSAPAAKVSKKELNSNHDGADETSGEAAPGAGREWRQPARPPPRADRHFPPPHGPRPRRGRAERGPGRADVQARRRREEAMLAPFCLRCRPGFPLRGAGRGALRLGGGAGPPRRPSRSSIRGASLCSAAAAMMRRRLPRRLRPRGAAGPRGDGAAETRGAGAARAGPTCDLGF